MKHNESGTIAIGAPGSAMRRITEPAEPSQPRHEYNVSTRTPWGTAQSATRFTEGLVMYSTASHGGFHVSKSLLKRIPEYLQTADAYAPGTSGWFEEDCASAIVIVCLPEFFPMEWRMDAVCTMQSTYAAQWQRFCEVRP